MGKALEEQTKTTNDQGEKQVVALNTLKSDNKLAIKKYSYDDEDTPFTSNQKELFNELMDERREKITDLDKKKVNSDNLIYRYKGNTSDVNFHKFDNAINIINKIQNGEIELADVKNNEQNFKSLLGKIKKGKKSKEQKGALYNIEMFYKARNEAIKCDDDYSLMMSEAKHKVKQNETERKQLEILTPKQML